MIQRSFPNRGAVAAADGDAVVAAAVADVADAAVVAAAATTAAAAAAAACIVMASIPSWEVSGSLEPDGRLFGRLLAGCKAGIALGRLPGGLGGSREAVGRQLRGWGIAGKQDVDFVSR